MQSDSQSLHDSRETIAYRQIPTSSESSIQTSNESNSNRDTNSPFSDFNMNESKYSKVIFSEISESYPTDSDIIVSFYIGDAVKPSDSDKIGLFRVGWVSAHECIVAKSVAECETDNDFGERKVRFDASQLPKHTEEFFQFCYLTKEDDICGASTPFRFIRPHEEDLIQLDNNRNSDEEDFVVVRSQQALLQERLQHLVNENGVLEYSKRSVEQQMASKTAELNEMRKLNVELEDRIKLIQLESNRVMDKLKTSEEQNVVKSERIEALELEFAETKKMKNDFEHQMEATQNEVMRLLEVIKNFEANDHKNEQILKSRDQEVVNLIKRTAEQQVLIDDLGSSKAMIEAKLELSSASIAKVMSERRDLDSENRMLRNSMDDMKAKCDSLQSKTEIMMSEILEFDKIKLKSKVQIKTMSEELEDMRQKWNQTVSAQQQMADHWKQKEEEFGKQVSEMKLRLSNAAEEYQKLYKYNTKIENRIDRIKAKVKKYFDTKTQTKSASNVSPTERSELLARAETEVKTVIESEVESAPTVSTVISTPTINTVTSTPTTSTVMTTENLESLTQMPCIICNEEIPCMSRDSKPMVQHLEEKHSQRLCPVCSTPFDTTLPGHRNYFQMHVDNHFDTHYPQASAPTPAPMVP